MKVSVSYTTRKLIILNQIYGYNNDHLIDNIDFTIPSELSGFTIGLVFAEKDNTPIGAVTLQTDWTSGTLTYVVPNALTIYDEILFQLVAAKNSTGQIWKSDIGHFYFKEPLPDIGDIPFTELSPYPDWIAAIEEAENATNSAWQATNAAWEATNAAWEAIELLGGGTAGNTSEETSSVLTITNGTGATLTNLNIQVKQSTGSQAGYLSAADWLKFNNAATNAAQWSGISTGLDTVAGRHNLGIGNLAVSVPANTLVLHTTGTTNVTFPTTGTLATTSQIPTVNDGALTFTITAASSGSALTVGTNTGFTANEPAGTVVYDIDVGPSLTALATIMNGATAGFLKKSANDTYSIDTSTYLTANQTITLSGDVSGSGTTSIAVTVTNDSHTHTGSSISALDAGDTTSGTFDIARIPTGTTGTTVSLGNHAHAGVYEPANANIQTHIGSTSNPHSVTADQISAAHASHVHGNITNAGAIGSTSGLMVKTTTSGILTTLAAGSSGQFLQYDGTWATPPDNNTTYTAGNGLGLSGTVFSLDTPGTLTASTSNGVTADSHTHAITTSSVGAGSTIVATNALGNVSLGNVTAASLIKSGGTASQFLKADGSVDSSTYITSSAVGNGALTLGVSGTGLSGSATFYANQGGAGSFTVTSNANASNGASTIVARDAGGNFAANTITANLSGTASLATNAAAWGGVSLPSLSANAGKVLTVTATNNGVEWAEGGGGAVIVPTYTRTTLVSDTNSAAIGTGYDPSKDSLTVFKNGVYLAPDSEYSVVGTNIIKSSGTWATGTIFDFVVAQTQSSDAITNTAVKRISSSYTATSDSTTNCLIGTSNWNSLTDELYVYYQNLLIFPSVDYTLNANGVSIDLTSFSINTGEIIRFEILRNVHTSQAAVSEPQMLGSTAVKAVFYNSNTIAENLTISNTINAMSAGPIVIDTGYTVSIEEGARWVIV